ncbi:hypothetical protein [Streptomyces sp. MUM 178J]|uniref:hypothetical protein n=1 Tax=Streptomyces sp. MUM 178J TaxID=2791991 RepID=UPI001F035298|nr:hypothetical protein [Streptomyces sp. MUM 178J]WRQ82785.1 hypothetical protein I3F59_027470 [Streptomyces sp. MUM 178J]
MAGVHLDGRDDLDAYRWDYPAGWRALLMGAGFTDVRTQILPAPRTAPDPVAGRTGWPCLDTMLVVAGVSGAARTG